MGDSNSDSDGPPPLTGGHSNSDSDGPPPLVDSSSDDAAHQGPQQNSSSESEPSEDDEYDDFTQIFQAMQQRAAHGAGWRQAVGNHTPLAIRDQMSREEQRREADRKAREEREEQQRIEDRRRDEERARKRAQQASLSDAYRRAKQTEQKALNLKAAPDLMMNELEACCKECEELIEKVDVVLVTEKDLAAEVEKTQELATALQVECYARWSLCKRPDGYTGPSPLELVEKAKRSLAQLPTAKSCSTVGLRGRLNGIKAIVHVAFGYAHFRLDDKEKAKEEARAAKLLSSISLRECPELNAYLEDEEQKLQQIVKDSANAASGASASVRVCEWGCGAEFPANTTRKERAAHRDTCEYRLVKCQKCQQTGIRFRDMALHESEVCTARLRACPKCCAMVRIDGFEKHDKEECEERDVCCSLATDGCSWVGPLTLRPYHDEICPYKMTQCQDCLENMREWEMMQHQCPLADGAEDCLICGEQLFIQPVAMLMKASGKMCSRICDHFLMHVECAIKWRSMSLRSKFASESTGTVSSLCPSCNREYDVVSPLLEHLVVPPENAEIRPVVAKVPAPADAAVPVKAAHAVKAKATGKAKGTSQTAAAPLLAPKSATAKQKATVLAEVAPVVPPSFHGASVAKSKAPSLPKPQVGLTVSASSGPFQPQPRIRESEQLVQASQVVKNSALKSDVELASDIPLLALPHATAEAVIRMPVATRSWMTELEKRRPQVSCLGPEKQKEWSEFYACPSEVHFCHDAVSEAFSPFKDSRGLWQADKTILDTVKEMATAALDGKRLPLEKIEVVWYTKDDWPRWTVAATFNRRLAVYRLLSIFMPDCFRRMKFVRVPLNHPKWYHPGGRPYHSTLCYGIYVEVGRNSGKYVGKYLQPEGDDEVGVRWPAAYDLFRKLKSLKG